MPECLRVLRDPLLRQGGALRPFLRQKIAKALRRRPPSVWAVYEITVNTIEHMRQEIVARRPDPATTPSLYGGAVMPAIEFYRSLESQEARLAYQDALEQMLRSESEEERSYAVRVCLGFFVFRDAMDNERDAPP